MNSLWHTFVFNSLIKGLIKIFESLARAKKDIVIDEASDSWNHLIENPKEWWDHRENKVNGLVMPHVLSYSSLSHSHSFDMVSAKSLS